MSSKPPLKGGLSLKGYWDSNKDMVYGLNCVAHLVLKVVGSVVGEGEVS